MTHNKREWREFLVLTSSGKGVHPWADTRVSSGIAWFPGIYRNLGEETRTGTQGELVDVVLQPGQCVAHANFIAPAAGNAVNFDFNAIGIHGHVSKENNGGP